MSYYFDIMSELPQDGQHETEARNPLVLTPEEDVLRAFTQPPILDVPIPSSSLGIPSYGIPQHLRNIPSSVVEFGAQTEATNLAPNNAEESTRVAGEGTQEEDLEPQNEINLYEDVVFRPISGRYTLGIQREMTRWWSRSYVWHSNLAASRLPEFDNPTRELEDDYNHQAIPATTIPKLAGRLAICVRQDINVEVKDKATILVVKEYLVRLMRSKNMRKSDIHRVLPFAVQLSFVPSRYDIQAREMMMQPEIIERLERFNTRLYTRGFTSIFNWFGRKHTEPIISSK